MARLNASLARPPSRCSSAASFATADEDGFASADESLSVGDNLVLAKTRAGTGSSKPAARPATSGSIDIFEDADEDEPSVIHATSEARCSDDEDEAGASTLRAISGNAKGVDIHADTASTENEDKGAARVSFLPPRDISNSEDEADEEEQIPDAECSVIVIDDDNEEGEREGEVRDVAVEVDDEDDPSPRPRLSRSPSATSLLSDSSDSPAASGSDDSLADFIVDDSASESELKRPYTPGRRRGAPAPTPRISRRRIIPDSDDDEDDGSPSVSAPGRSRRRRASPSDLASDMSALRISAPKSFDSTKIQLAESFLADLDRKVTKGVVSEKAGTVPIVWSNSLKTTAGSARFKPLPASLGEERRYTTTIQLAASIIKTKEQLYNTLAHEFCHVAVFHVDGAARHGHGRLFKRWARRAERAFPNRNLTITTRHSYELDHKYAWRCEECRHVIRRPTRSVNVERKSCGRCRGKLREVDVETLEIDD